MAWFRCLLLRSTLITAVLLLICSPSPSSAATHPTIESGRVGRGGGGDVGQRRRLLLGFTEKRGGGNSTFECSPSGPCVPCQYSEKKDDNFRCSETGYRIPLKCMKVTEKTKTADLKNRSILEGSSDQANMQDAETIIMVKKYRSLLKNGSKDEADEYIAYRSCIPAVDEERLSVLGFEVFILGLLLVSGSIVFLRQKKTTNPMSGVGGVRLQSNSRY
ncbi:hypothetical protein Droror1_Dr00020381 [Drosera rotundifolia]